LDWEERLAKIIISKKLWDHCLQQKSSSQAFGGHRAEDISGRNELRSFGKRESVQVGSASNARYVGTHEADRVSSLSTKSP